MQVIEDIITDCINRIKAAYGVEMPRPTYKFSNRMTTTLGAASWRGGAGFIKFSSKRFVGKTHTPEFEDTVRHEIAHVADRFINGKFNDHNAIWRRIAIICGANPTQYASTEKCAALNPVGVRYQCKCTDKVYLSKVRHNKVVRGLAKYNCRCCKQELTQYKG